MIQQKPIKQKDQELGEDTHNPQCFSRFDLFSGRMKPSFILCFMFTRVYSEYFMYSQYEVLEQCTRVIKYSKSNTEYSEQTSTLLITIFFVMGLIKERQQNALLLKRQASPKQPRNSRGFSFIHVSVLIVDKLPTPTTSTEYIILVYILLVASQRYSVLKNEVIVRHINDRLKITRSTPEQLARDNHL